MTTSPLPPVVRRVVGVALAAWVGVLVVILLSTSSAGPSWLIHTVAGIVDGLGFPNATERVEFVLNVAAFVPVSFLGTLLWSRITWRDWTAGVFVASFIVESVQAVALTNRAATHADVVANTLGALVGAVLGGLLIRAGLGSSERSADLPDRLAATE